MLFVVLVLGYKNGPKAAYGPYTLFYIHANRKQK